MYFAVISLAIISCFLFVIIKKIGVLVKLIEENQSKASNKNSITKEEDDKNLVELYNVVSLLTGIQEQNHTIIKEMRGAESQRKDIINYQKWIIDKISEVDSSIRKIEFHSYEVARVAKDYEKYRLPNGDERKKINDLFNSPL